MHVLATKYKMTMTLIPLELQPTPNTSRRKAREAKRKNDWGMNRQNERSLFTFISFSVVHIYLHLYKLI